MLPLIVKVGLSSSMSLEMPLQMCPDVLISSMGRGDDSVVKVLAVQARGPELGSSEPIQTLGGYQPGKVERGSQSSLALSGPSGFD